MNYEFNQSVFSKAILTALFIGIVDTVICLAYNIFYREHTGFMMQDYINVSSLIFAVNLIFTVIGIIYFVLLKSFRKGDLVFIVVFALLTIFCVWKVLTGQRTDNHELNVAFRGLLTGIIVIMGLSALAVPYLFHNRTFEKHVL